MVSAVDRKRPHKLFAVPYFFLFVGLIAAITMFVTSKELSAFWMIVAVMGGMILLDLILDLVYGTTPLRISFWASS